MPPDASHTAEFKNEVPRYQTQEISSVNIISPFQLFKEQPVFFAANVWPHGKASHKSHGLLVTPEKAHDAVLRLGFGAHEVQKGVGWEEVDLPIRLLHRNQRLNGESNMETSQGLVLQQLEPIICHCQLEEQILFKQTFKGMVC